MADKLKMFKRGATWLLILFAVCLNGCGKGSLPLAPETTNTPPAVSATTVHTLTPTIHPSQVVSTPYAATATMQVLTPPFRPTLQPSDAKTLVTNLLQGNGGCRLPCIWGIDLQKTSFSEAQAFVGQFGKFTGEDLYLYSTSWGGGKVDDGGGMVAHIQRQDLVLMTGFDYYGDKTTLKRIVLHATAGKLEGEPPNRGTRTLYDGSPYFEEKVGYYLLPQFLKREGKPSAIWIYPIQEDERKLAKMPFSLLMVYEDRGFMIEYRFTKLVRGEKLTGCPAKAGEFDLSTWDARKKPSLSEILPAVGNQYSFGMFYKPLQETTAMTVDEFYTTYTSEQSTKCLTTKQSFWPRIE